MDGVRDTGFVGSPRLPRSVQNTSIGGALRTGITGVFGGGMIDDVAVWNRALTDQEIMMLSTNVTPAAPPILIPLQVISFRADFAEVVSGDSATLRWNVAGLSGGGISLDINQGVGNVLGRTTNGIGSIILSNITSTATYTLTAERDTNIVTAQIGVGVVNGVAAGWSVLDDFQTYSAGAFVNPYWADLSGGSTIEEIGGNRMLNTASGGGQMALLPLVAFTVNPGQARTIFARIYVQDDPALGGIFFNEIGLTDKSLRNPNDLDSDAGPVVRLGTDLGGQLAIGARNGVPVPAVPANLITLIPRKLEYQQVYNVWMDVTNGVFTTNDTGDSFSIWVQRVGSNTRTPIASNYTTDRDIEPDFLGATLTNLTQLAVGNDGGSSATVYVDDLFISKSGYNSTVPVPWAGPTPPALAVPTFTPTIIPATEFTPMQIQFDWSAGALMSAPTITGPWTVVADSFGFSYLWTIDPADPQRFFVILR